LLAQNYSTKFLVYSQIKVYIPQILTEVAMMTLLVIRSTQVIACHNMRT